MDNLTHTLTGVLLGRAGLERRFGRGTTLLLALASNVPDVDAILVLGGRNFAPSRRTLTHSVVGVPLLALILAWSMRRATPGMPFRTRFGLGLLGASLHVFMDLLNSYGVCIYYPLATSRHELAWTFIIDLAMWAILLAPLLTGSMLARRLHVARERIYQAAAVALALYVGLCGAGHARAASLLARELRVAALQSAPAERAVFPELAERAVFPEPFGPQRFRGVARVGDEYRSWLLHVVGGQAEPLAPVHTDADLPEIRAVRERPEARRIESFFKAPVWRMRRDLGVAEVTDLRFASAVLARRNDAFAYRFPLIENTPGGPTTR